MNKLIKNDLVAIESLYGRKAAQFCQEAGKCKEEVFLEDDNGRRVSAKSLLGLLSLGIDKGKKYQMYVSMNDEKTEDAIKYLLSILGGVV